MTPGLVILWWLKINLWPTSNVIVEKCYTLGGTCSLPIPLALILRLVGLGGSKSQIDRSRKERQWTFSSRWLLLRLNELHLKIPLGFFLQF